MTLHDLLAAIGIDPTVLYAGTGGGILRALSRQRIRLREILVSPPCGALAAAYLTLPTVHYLQAAGLPLPINDQQTVLACAFLLGTCAMWITDVLVQILARWLGLERNEEHKKL
jgi:hypothetical protein